MRINKQVIEYVTQKVNELADAKHAAICKELETLSSERNIAFRKYKDEVEAIGHDAFIAIAKVAKKHGYKFRHADRFTGHCWCLNYDIVDHFHVIRDDDDEVNSRIADLNKELNKLEALVKIKSNEIVARLSLGGTAKDLDQMLAGVRF